MATFAVSRQDVVVKLYCCTICEEERFEEVDADFYCKTCLKYFCRTCIKSHRQHGLWFNKISLVTFDTLKDETLSMYCPDHSQLCCSRF